MTDTDALRAALAKVTPGTGTSCEHCGGYGETFVHLPDCRNDDCVLAGGIDDCNGRVEQCFCQTALLDAVRTHGPSLLDRIAELEAALEPFVRAGSAMGAYGDDPGPFRFYTDAGYREMDAESFRRARLALNPEVG